MSRARIWHRAAVIGLLVVPAPLLAGVAAPAGSDAPRPLEIVWQVDDERDGDELRLVVDARSGDVLALTSSFDSSQLRRLDGRTGAVEWAVEATRMSRVASDGAGGAVLAGEGAQGQTLLSVSADGVPPCRRRTRLRLRRRGSARRGRLAGRRQGLRPGGGSRDAARLHPRRPPAPRHGTVLGDVVLGG